ncbi:glycine cleavage system protein GcvH [Thiospirochaeta perfilievii]|uniref:Glycine cleavage system H protein n=1 Tax=Thiospirochaeta perfilievii TaxID=252967 RepID=A0A5C1Q9D3_9SPIO|nr:glycine cleavage system protein GcvH [Thiospirochaeta perfilievii]QEN03509.1 glycine cleavage system protein GcvH [Thiospirochaeta perfilievii]
MSSYPDELKYAISHEWIKKEGDIFIVGISDFAQNQLGDIVYVDFPEVGDKIEKDGALGELESSKAVSEINMPFDGEVIEINPLLEDNPELINSDPYNSWIVKIEAENPNDFDDLLSASKAKELAEGSV